MSFLEDALAHHDANSIPKCRVAHILDQMTQQQQEEVIDALRMPSTVLSSVAIAKALNDRGFKIQDQSVSRHRGGKCKCPESTR